MSPSRVTLTFSPPAVDLDESRAAQVTLRNTGSAAGGPVDIVPGPVRDAGGTVVPEAAVTVEPTEVPSLAPGETVTLALTLDLPEDLAGGEYEAAVAARIGESELASLSLSWAVPDPASEVGSLAITGGPGTVREGDAVRYEAEALDPDGQPIADPVLSWTVVPAQAGLVTEEGAFVGYEPGPAQVVVSATGDADTIDVQIDARGGLRGGFQVVGRGEVTARFTSDLWVHPSAPAVYTGTWGTRAEPGDRVFVWDISDPSAPVLTDSITLDAGTVNDVKVHPDGSLAVATHEGSFDGANGITILSLDDPLHPTVITRFTEEMNLGVHNVWVEGDFVYAVDSRGRPMKIVDVSNPTDPTISARFAVVDPTGVGDPPSFLHDVYVRDGLAFLSQWDDGLVIVDVGNGIAGGSPSNPVEVSRIEVSGFSVHNAWYWPEAGYVFLGDERKELNAPHGTMKVIDVRDLGHPREVASYDVPASEAPSNGPHNFWVDEARGILYAAWYEAGIRAIDVSGELLGDLHRGGREIGSLIYGEGFTCPRGTIDTCTWAPQLDEGLIYLSDMNTGLWVLEPTF